MSNLRLAGLASGMDTDAMVQSLMRVERMKVDRYEQNKQVSLWRQEQYNNVNKIFANFILNTKKDIGLNQTNIRGAISSVNYNRLDYIRKATSSNETVASVSSTSKAVNGSFDIEVKQLATSGSITSSDLKDFINDGGLKGGMSFKINGQEITVGEAGNNIEMSDVAKAINAKKDETNVTAFYDEANGRLFMQSTIMGAPQSGRSLNIVLAKTGSDSGNAFIDAVRKEGFQNRIGKDAIIEYNGTPLTYSSNQIEFNGLNIELKETGKTNIKVETNAQGIYDKIEKLINDYNELIDKVSSLLGEKRYSSYHPLSMEEKKGMHEDDVKLWEEKARSGLLNRDETINRALQSMRRYLYDDVAIDNGSGLKHITQIGISTESYSRGTTGGKLQIDKEKLMDEIMKDPEAVMELLFREPKYGEGVLDGVTRLTSERGMSSDKIAAKRSQSGIFNRIYDELIGGMQNIIDKSGSGADGDLYRSVKSNILLDFVTNKSSISDIDKDVQNMNKRIDDLNAMLLRKENAYYAKFANMEKMLHQMYSQSDWLAQQFIR